MKYTELEGFTEKQLQQHHGVLYTGYVKKLNQIEPDLEKADRSKANATFSEIGELKRQQVFATNAIKLHEGYFDNLGGDGKPSGALLDLIIRDFGSIEKWEEDLVAAGIASRGWVVLAYDWDDRKLHHYSSDYHSQGVWNCTALLVLDVYEHAYFIDFATARKNYIETFLKNVDWTFLGERVKQLRILEHRNG
ncbi:Fe-Mn family superoxide dismutase [Candidatus Micrarchaeota archaeon]|nr:Fe-Mn family superoxide dismutase [Candidatus Micrarchaeota archaeon]